MLHRFICPILLSFFLSLHLASPDAASASEPVFSVLSRADGTEIEINFSLEELEAMPQVTVLTENEFVDGMTAFSGPLARIVLKKTNDVSAERVKLIAANNYHIDVPVEDFRKYDVILATRQNGTLFSRRDKGPIWLIYPMSDHSELQDSTYNSRLIWQLVRMEVLAN